MRNFRELKVWQKSHGLVLAVYKATTRFPREELYGLTNQIRRASTSIPANIAEGCGRAGETELARFLQIAMGSASELEYYLLLARDLDFLKALVYEGLDSQVTEVKRMLTSFFPACATLEWNSCFASICSNAMMAQFTSAIRIMFREGWRNTEQDMYHGPNLGSQCSLFTPSLSPFAKKLSSEKGCSNLELGVNGSRGNSNRSLAAVWDLAQAGGAAGRQKLKADRLG